MNKIFTIILASVFLFACSNDDQTDNDDQTQGLVFEVTASSQSSDGFTKGAVYSQEASQHVTRVNVYAFLNNGTNYLYKKTYTITGWTDGTTSKTQTIPDVDKLPAGDYKFLAVGQDATDMYTITTPTSTTKFEDMAASVAAAGNETEIFAGYSQTPVLIGGARVAIVISRKVAGVLGYFKNVPQTVNGQTVKYLRLTASATNLTTNLSTGAGSVVGATNYNLIDIDLSTQSVSNGVYTGNTLADPTVVKVANSQLSGNFMIPVGTTTLTLKLSDATGIAIKTWTVQNLLASSFPIVANNFYSLGLKTKATTTTGTDGLPGTPDDDAPLDLLTDETISVTINPNWDLINYLIIQ